jgi:hypothetical protein
MANFPIIRILNSEALLCSFFLCRDPPGARAISKDNDPSSPLRVVNVGYVITNLKYCERHDVAQRSASAADQPERSGGRYVGWKQWLDVTLPTERLAQLRPKLKDCIENDG